MQDEKQREEYKIFCDNVKKWTVHDYFTPNIKAEVILDMLLTPYIAPILNQYFEKKTVVYVTKEFPIGIRWSKGKAILSEDNKSNKVDYVCMDEDTLYLVELKTTDESFSERQDSCYRKLLEETQKYGSGTYLSGVLKKYWAGQKTPCFVIF